MTILVNPLLDVSGLKTHYSKVMSRPLLFSVVGVILANFGPSWRDHRRFALTTMRNFGLGKNSMADRIHGELQYTVEALEKHIGVLSVILS